MAEYARLILAITAAFLVVSGCHYKNSNTERKNAQAPVLSFHMDGSGDRWANKTPLIAEVGLTGRGDFNGIDIKRFHFENDHHYLYVFMECEPSLEDAYNEKPSSGAVAKLLFDVDNNPATGCKSLLQPQGNNEQGYEVGVFIQYGQIINLVSQTVKRDLFYNIENLNEEGEGIYSRDEFRSDEWDNNPLIVTGKAGVEMAIPLDRLGVKPGQTVRLLVFEQSHWYDKRALVPVMLTLSK